MPGPPLESVRPAGEVVHVAGSPLHVGSCPDAVQACRRCGEILIDTTGANYPDGEGPLWYAVGDMIAKWEHATGRVDTTGGRLCASEDPDLERECAFTGCPCLVQDYED